MTRGLVGERQAEDRGRVDALADQPAGPLGEGLGLAGARPGEREDPPLDVVGDFFLIGVQMHERLPL